MDMARITYRLVENLRKVVLDHGDELQDIKKSIKEIKHYFSFKMLMIYFVFILTQAIAITFWVSKQDTTIAILQREVQELKQSKKSK
jgi:polysaccharide deacetylase 2 family uncharacterized protein YibQ